MDFLNKAYAQVVDLFQSMSPGARITAGLLLVTVAVSLAYLFNYQMSGGDTYLLGGESFSSDEMNRMQAAFGKSGLSSFTPEGNKIKIPRGQQDVYLAALADAGALPANFDSILEKALSEGSAFENSNKSEVRVQIAKQRRLAMIIGEMNGIERATVDIGTQREKGWGRGETHTAAVVVWPDGANYLDDQQVRMIRDVVTRAFGVNDGQVTVADAKHKRSFPGGGDGPGSAFNNDYLNLTREHQRDFESRILSALSGIPGVTADVTVTLTKERRNIQESIKVNPKEVAVIQSSEKTSESNSQTNAPAGRPGLQSQGGGLPNQAAAVAATGGPQSRIDETTGDTQSTSFPSHDQITIEKTGLTPESVAVAIQVPNIYLADLYRAENPPPDGEEPKTPTVQDLTTIRDREFAKVTEQVKTLLKPVLPATATLDELVSVTSFGPMLLAAPPEEGMAEKALLWLGQYWRTLGMFGLVGFSLIMLRSMIRSGPARMSDSPLGVSPPSPAATDEEDEEGVAKPQLKRRDRGSPSLTGELTSLVREDPDTAADILRSWITTAN